MPPTDKQFSIRWPTEPTLARIVTPFGASPGLTVHAPMGTPIKAVTEGKVTAVLLSPVDEMYVPLVEVTTLHNSLEYIITYCGLADVSVLMRQTLKAGDVIGKAAENTITLIVHENGKAVDPFALLAWDDETLRFQPSDNLRIRDKASTTGSTVLKEVRSYELLKSLEPLAQTLTKIGVDGQWLRVETPDKVQGFAAAWMLTPVEAGGAPISGQITGVNLDIYHPLGSPEPARMAGIGWLRLAFNVSFDPTKSGRAQYGNTDVDAAINRYMPFIDQYAAAGHRIMLVCTHQTFGEGRDEFYPYSSLTADRWRQLTQRYSEFVARAAERFKGKVQAYQIWNEQDTGWNRPDISAQSIVAAVPLKPEDYAIVLAGGIQAVRSADPTAKVITGGHVNGPGLGPQYARITLQNLPSGVRPDGIACHPYGRGAQGSKREFMHFGLIDEEIDGYLGVAPDIPVWITEWGVLGPGNEPPPASPEDMADYAARFVQLLKDKYAGKVAAAIWFAWWDTMHNGYGMVDRGVGDKAAFVTRYKGL